MERVRRSAQLKKGRRIELGDRMSILFENKDTVLQQIQEMVYLDKLSKPEDIKREIDIYSSLLPCNGKIKASLYIYAENEDDLRKVFKTLPKIYDSIFMKVGNKLIKGEPEAGREQGEEFSTVQFLTFDLENSRDTNMEVLVIHENYRVNAKVDEALAKKLIEEAYSEC
ncbi:MULTISPECIES: DUF3501 family protein [Metallosphaera]|uniref:Uncharacterized protein n=3 Tax=Metallosphaera TaxID=41980 RepID=A4YDG9_METS5|nr:MULTISPECIES: DUF3501 family protein [Metallosphaera]ABP94471.1 hypothetical protein Msed_0294 [Metallosphaera sedula DSM 5348]AIM26458.1 hypothetical protein HA72_0294 [Metallosphaera sedula]AKV75224.1 fructose-bisphosphate aldolase [Metallosphaera sedula]AKV77462.1 fructose-bisphosphate aldolase [Metallosphaera sedula]AKV79713.1 fructose-bisphosphate aldolase [Metallosphaera sedula]